MPVADFDTARLINKLNTEIVAVIGMSSVDRVLPRK